MKNIYLSLLLPRFFLRRSTPEEDAELAPKPFVIEGAVTVEVNIVKSEDEDPHAE